MKNLVLIFLSAIMVNSAQADGSLSQQMSQTRESICYNHPNKELCKQGIIALMKSSVDATRVVDACEDVVKKGGSSRPDCFKSEEAIKWINSN